MSLDEFECIRLIDYEGITQEECAEQINMDRTSVTLMYARARKKLAECLVTGKELRIEGGNYEFCPGNLEQCHAPNEYVQLDAYLDCILIYARLILTWAQK